ncbi:HI0074 family nucleotidyltransferase substrate-binding subunit [uncultured Sphaerochaeta sp.]|uniref:HI0074 family nucleotidyltransferase substrate-binding subunit n=1 Tax=uncultured Sphaerochaeta sp. TaxID=886478 RepID=UPI0029C9D184|nr:HI0074 family nucleotidyltransferase substrate-binding subunit [uncultured Sphaerochaeta sp.]
MSRDIPWVNHLSHYALALSQLRDAVVLAKQRSLSALEQQGIIHSFENTHELSWKVLGGYLKDQGIQELYGPKDAVHAALAVGLIQEEKPWMDMIRDRGQIYDLEVTDGIVTRITSSYIHNFQKLLETFTGFRVK